MAALPERAWCKGEVKPDWQWMKGKGREESGRCQEHRFLIQDKSLNCSSTSSYVRVHELGQSFNLSKGRFCYPEWYENKRHLIGCSGKDPDVGKDWRQKEKRAAEDGMVGMASPTQWTWVWANSGRQWRTGKPGMLQSTGPQRVRHDWATEPPPPPQGYSEN